MSELQFLALASFMLIFTDAHYPYSQQQHHVSYSTQHHGAQNYYPNANYQRYNSIQNNNNIAYSNYNSNSHSNYNNNNNNNIKNNNNVIEGHTSKSIDEFIKSNRRSGQNSNPLLALKLPKIYLGDFEYAPTPNGYRFSYDRDDGTRYTEVGVIPDSENTGIYERDQSVEAERMMLRMRGRENSKNRKLSPKSLQSLAG